MRKTILPIEQQETIEQFLIRCFTDGTSELERDCHIDVLNDPVRDLEAGPHMFSAMCDLVQRVQKLSCSLDLAYGNQPQYVILSMFIETRKKGLPLWDTNYLSRIGKHRTPPELHIRSSLGGLPLEESYFKRITLDQPETMGLYAYFICDVPEDYNLEEEGYYALIFLVHTKPLGSDKSSNISAQLIIG